MSSSPLAWLPAVALAAAAAACSGPTGGSGECSACHTSPDIELGELFRGLDGVTDTAIMGVGAHAQHVARDTYTAALLCEDCHHVPGDIGDIDHFLGGRAEVRFGTLAAVGVRPRWDPATGTCSQVYCHGALPLDDEDPMPTVTAVWNATDGTDPLCDGCHAVPPSRTRDGLPHPPSPACGTCHPTANQALEITDPTRHIDGVVDVDTTQ